MTKNKCILCDKQHRFFSRPIKFGTKGKNLCFNCLKNGHRTQSCKSTNKCFQQDCSNKCHTAQHYAFQKASAEEHQADPNISVGMSTHGRNEDYLQIVPVLISGSTGKMEKAYILLDTGSQSTLIRETFVTELKLHGNKSKIKMSSIKDQGESIIVHEADLRISSIVNNKIFEVKGAFIFPVEKFNMLSQKYLGLQHVSHLKV